jgi:hypothetical protein
MPNDTAKRANLMFIDTQANMERTAAAVTVEELGSKSACFFSSLMLPVKTVVKAVKQRESHFM